MDGKANAVKDEKKTDGICFSRPKINNKEKSPMKVKGRKELAEDMEVKRTSCVHDQRIFSESLPLWIDMCLECQKQKRSWDPSEPCCLPNLFVSKPEPMPNVTSDELQPCWLKLSSQERCAFRQYVRSGEADRHAAWVMERSPNEEVARHAKLFNPLRSMSGESSSSRERHNQGEDAKDHDVQGVTWNASANAWEVKWYEGEVFCSVKSTHLYKVKRFRVVEQGNQESKIKVTKLDPETRMRYEEAKQKALHAAISWQKQAIAKGIIKKLGPKRKLQADSLTSSTETGSSDKRWRQQAESLALEHVLTSSGSVQSRAGCTKVVKRRAPKKRMGSASRFVSGMRGVYWKRNQWRVLVTCQGKSEYENFKALNDTPEEIERTRKLAVKRRVEVMDAWFGDQVVASAGVRWSSFSQAFMPSRACKQEHVDTVVHKHVGDSAQPQGDNQKAWQALQMKMVHELRRKVCEDFGFEYWEVHGVRANPEKKEKVSSEMKRRRIAE